MIAHSRHYTGVLRWKAGERAALARVDRTYASSFCPLVEPAPKAFRAALDSAEAFQGVLRKTAQAIGPSWGQRPFFVDDHLIDPFAARHGIVSMEELLRESIACGLNAARFG